MEYPVPQSKLINVTVPFLLIISSTTSADIPLTVEELLSKKGQTRFQLSATYLNTENRSADLLTQQSLQDTVTNPQTILAESINNSDTLVTTATIRHGITKDLEVYGHLSGLISSKRSQNYLSPEIISDATSRFSSSWVGVNYRFREDYDNKPALLGFAEIQLAQKASDKSSTVYGKSLLLGGTTYQTYDPIVLSLTGSLQLNAKRKQSESSIRPGHALTLSPSIGFAVNDKVTLTTGANWRIQKSHKVDNQKSSFTKTSTNISLGLGYAISKKNILSANIQPNVSGSNGVQANVAWTYKMDK